MSLDRAELAGTGTAIAFHAALIAALSLSLAHVTQPSEPPPMEPGGIERSVGKARRIIDLRHR